MKRQSILITIDWFLPGTKSGGPVRSYANMIDHLGKYHDFFIITRDSDYCSNEVYDSIVSNSWNQLNDYTSVYYFSKENLNKKNLKTLLESTEFDILYINGIYSWFFSIVPLLVSDKKQKTIVAARGMLNPQAFSVKGFKKKLFLKLAVLFDLYKKVTFHATNADEASFIKSIIGKNSLIHIASNLPRGLNPNFQQKHEKRNPVRFINVARISIEKGTLVMLRALEHIKYPLVLDLYGPIYDQDYWVKCQNVISQLPDHIRVSYKDVLDSEKIPDVLIDYDFFVLLSEGENFGHAILEALSSGLPVLISDQTPWKALASKWVGWDVDIKNQNNIIEAFNTAIQMSDSEYAIWSKSAFKYADAFINNPEVLEQNKALFLNPLN
ncbi:MAG: glycosyltransferase [Gelidibacter sp.]